MYEVGVIASGTALIPNFMKFDHKVETLKGWDTTHYVIPQAEEICHVAISLVPL
jgi:hypothetical protein